MATLPQLELDRQLCFRLYAASRAFTRAYAPVLEPLDLTYPQYLTMLALWDADEPVAVRDLGSRLRLDSGTLTPLLKRLEAQGRVRRQRDHRDERRVLVELTDQGAALRDRAGDVPLEMLTRIPLSEADWSALRELLDRLIGALDRASPEPQP